MEQQSEVTHRFTYATNMHTRTFFNTHTRKYSYTYTYTQAHTQTHTHVRAYRLTISDLYGIAFQPAIVFRDEYLCNKKDYNHHRAYKSKNTT